MSYTLYKNPIQLDTLAIVQYLHSIGTDMRPQKIIERLFPEWVTELPSIEETYSGTQYVGMQQCVQFWEQQSGVTQLQQKAAKFKHDYPNYRIEG